MVHSLLVFVVVVAVALNTAATWLAHGSVVLAFAVAFDVVAVAFQAAAVAVAYEVDDESFDLVADQNHPLAYWCCYWLAEGYTYLDSFREMAPYSSADSIAFHLSASFVLVASGNYDASDSLAAFVMDASVALDIVVDSPSGPYHRNSSLDFPFDELEALAVARTLAVADVALVASGAFVPIAMFAVDDTVASDRQSFLESVQALLAIEIHHDHRDQSIVDVRAEN